MKHSALLGLGLVSAVAAQSKCPELQDPLNGSVDCQNVFGVNVCTVTCHKGYTSHHTNMFACADDQGDWTPKVENNAFPACYPENSMDRCNEELKEPENGKVRCEIDQDTGDKMCYPECNEGY